VTSIVPDIINTAHGAADTSNSVDTDMQRVLQQLADLHGLPIETLNPVQARAQPTPADAVTALPQSDRDAPGEPRVEHARPDGTSSDRLIPGAETDLSVRVYTPAGSGPFPLVVYFHGGGWVIADKDTYDAGARGISHASDAVVVSVDYRRAPEHQFPAAWDDALAAYEWVALNAAALNGDSQRIALAGESAGGTLAIATAVAVRGRRVRQPKAILAIYPITQTGNDGTESYNDSAQAKPLNKAMIAWFMDKLLKSPFDRADTRLDLINADLTGLPPVTIINAQIDPLRSDGALLEAALRDAGVDVTRRVYEGVTHEFFGMAAVVHKAAEAQEFAGDQLKQAFAKVAARRFKALLPREIGFSSQDSLFKLKAIGYAAKHSFSDLKPFEFERESARNDEIVLDVLYCGVCHSDIHQVKNEWSNTIYPCVPGHEIVGRVREVGAAVTRHQVGDVVGVGCMIDSCRHCEACLSGDENYCGGPNSWLATYNGPMVPAEQVANDANMYGVDNTFGGYSNVMVVDEDFALKIPGNLRPEIAAPILCAGATTYSPLKHWGVKPGDRVGVIGFGGLGDMAAKIAIAMGADVILFTRTQEKLAEAERIGAKAVLETDTAAIKGLHDSFDFIISTVPEKHDINPFIPLLKRDKTICVVGALETMAGVDNQALAFQRKNVAGSLIANLQDTQEVLDFCAQHDIGPEIELIGIDAINDAFKRVIKAEVRFRYVIDMASLRGKPPTEGVSQF